jgi:Tfp pilus assembly protein PilZ
VTALTNTLLVCFEEAEAFQREYDGNLANGGVFVASDGNFVLREAVEVELDLRFAETSVTLPGEIVHIVPPEMADMGGTPGAAVQFTDPPPKIREKLAAFVDTVPKPPPATATGRDRRGSRRTTARISARIDAGEAVLDGHTRDLSETGVLVGVHGEDVPESGSVRLTLRHPTTGEERELKGEVVRRVETGGEVSAVAVQFEQTGRDDDSVARFVTDIQRVEHTRRLGGISGAIEELGPQSLVQMFANTAPRGTLYLRKGEEEGAIGFEGGLLLYVRCGGGTTGMKALVRLLSWRDGTFEFHANLEERDKGEPPFPLEAAVFDAVHQIDEGARIDATRFPNHAVLSVYEHADLSTVEPLCKIEAAVLDLARAGFTVQRLLDVIPEPDPQILRALESLCNEGVVVLDA